MELSTIALKNLAIIVVSLSAQQAIAEYLNEKCGEIDALLADIKEEIETLEQYKRSVITESVTKGLNSSASMKNSGVKWIGDMPAHWECVRGIYLLKYLQNPVKKGVGLLLASATERLHYVAIVAKKA